MRCDHCKHEYLLAFSCKGRWFCPSCHQKKVQLFGALLSETILFPVPHRHVTFGMPKMLRPYFRFDRDLLKDRCRIAHECLLEYLRTTLDLPDGLPGIVMAIHTFGEYLDFHPHLHALVADGLFVRSRLFYVLPDAGLKPLEELFRARVITFLVAKGLLPPARGDPIPLRPAKIRPWFGRRRFFSKACFAVALHGQDVFSLLPIPFQGGRHAAPPLDFHATRK